MTLAVITSLYKPYARGGAEVVAETVSHELQKKHRVIVITTSAWKGLKSMLPSRADEEGVIVYRYYPFNIFAFSDIENGKPFFLRLIWHFFDTFNVHSYLTVRHILKKERPDTVLTHNLKGIGYCVVRAIRALRIFHIHTVHDVQLVAPSGVIMVGKDHEAIFRFSAGLYSFLHKSFFGSPEVVVFPSRFLQSFYRRWSYFPKSHVKVLPNPVPPSLLFEDGVFNSMQSARLDTFTSGRRTFLYVGLVKKQKGIYQLLSAFSQLPRNSCIQLFIAGTGQEETQVRKIAESDSRITVMGYVDRARLRQILRETHFVVLPSLLYENSPMVVYESFAAGIPVIVSESGGAAELVTDSENGYIVEAGNESALLHALERAIQLDVKTYQRMSISARARVEDCTVEKYCERLLEASETVENVIPAPDQVHGMLHE